MSTLMQRDAIWSDVLQSTVHTVNGRANEACGCSRTTPVSEPQRRAGLFRRRIRVFAFSSDTGVGSEFGCPDRKPPALTARPAPATTARRDAGAVTRSQT